MKKCIDCGLEKEMTEFHLEKRNKDGHRNNCKEINKQSINSGISAEEHNNILVKL